MDKDSGDNVTGVNTESIPIVNSVSEIFILWLLVAMLVMRILMVVFLVQVIGCIRERVFFM